MIDYIVEANRFEHSTLFNMYDGDVIWEKTQSGDAKIVGLINYKVVMISRLIDTINDKKVLFWYPTSRMVDYTMIDDWLDKEYPKVSRVDADNFGSVLGELKLY